MTYSRVSPLLLVVYFSLAIQILVPGTSLGQAQCSPDWNSSLGRIQGVTENVNFVGSGIAAGTIDSAISAWTTACSSTDLPDMTAGGGGLVTVTIEYHSGGHFSGSCGMTDAHDIPASNPDYDRQVGDGSVIHLYETGNIGVCDPLDTLTHEMGHILGMGDAPGSCAPGRYIMAPQLVGQTRMIYAQDCQKVEDANSEPPPDDPPPDDPPPPCPPGGSSSNSASGPGGNYRSLFVSAQEQNPESTLKDAGGGSGGDYPCTGPGGVLLQNINGYSPIVVDLDRGGFRFTDLENGVWFDMDFNGEHDWISWTDPTHSDGFLVLDRNLNGQIDDGSEMFGNFTDQPPSDEPNGYEALAVFDQPQNGGNGDGLISDSDPVFQQLRLWIDSNHDAVSQQDELSTPGDHNIESFDLSYNTSNRHDQHGNILRHKSKAHRSHGGVLQTVDVFFMGLAPYE